MMRKILQFCLLLLITVIVLPTTSCASTKPGHGFWSRMTKPSVRVHVTIPFMAGTYVEYYAVEDVRRPSRATWENYGTGFVAEGWSRSFSFRVHSEGAIIDTVYYVFDGKRTNVGVRKPRQRVNMNWSVPNMENNAPMTMEVVVYMHVEGGPIYRWPSPDEPASFTLIHHNLRDLRSRPW